MRISKKLMTQISLFLLVGGTTFLIDLTVTTTLFHIFHLPAYLASAIGFLSGFFFSFPMNRKNVFKHSHLDKFDIKMQVIMFISLSIFNLLITSALVEVIVYLGLDISIAKVFVTILIATWNFFILKFLIFSKKTETDQSR